MFLELKAELKSWCTNALSWMAFMKEKERAVEPVGQHSLRFTEILATAGGFAEYGVQLVSSLCPHHGHSPSGFAKSSRP